MKMLVELMLHDLERIREKEDYKTASSYYGQLYKLAIELYSDEDGKDTLTAYTLLDIILTELPDRHKKRISHRLREMGVSCTEENLEKH